MRAYENATLSLLHWRIWTAAGRVRYSSTLVQDGGGSSGNLRTAVSNYAQLVRNAMFVATPKRALLASAKTRTHTHARTTRSPLITDTVACVGTAASGGKNLSVRRVFFHANFTN